MKMGIRAAIQRIIEQHIIADDPYPERTWLDQQDMPLMQLKSPVAVAGLPVEPLPPLRDRSGHGRDRRADRRVLGRH